MDMPVQILRIGTTVAFTGDPLDTDTSEGSCQSGICLATVMPELTGTSYKLPVECDSWAEFSATWVRWTQVCPFHRKTGTSVNEEMPVHTPWLRPI